MQPTYPPRKSAVQAKTTVQHRTQQPRVRNNPGAGIDTYDPYLNNAHYAEMSHCERCGIIHHESRWYRPADLPDRVRGEVGKGPEVICPACRKIDDMYAMGVVEIRGPFALQHREELEGMIYNVEARRLERNPLERVMKIGDQENGFDVLTTDEGLALQIARRLEHSYQGQITFNFDGGEQRFLRATWSR